MKMRTTYPAAQHDKNKNDMTRKPRRTQKCNDLLAQLRMTGDLYAESGQTLQGSFSAVSKPNFASKYAFESSRRDLHNALLCKALKTHFSKKC